MKKKYGNYTAEDFAADTEFILWVKEGKNSQNWENLILEYPQLAMEIKVAKKIIRSLNFSKNVVNKELMEESYQEISHHFDIHKKFRQRTYLFRLMRYAAFIILFLSVSTVATYYFYIDTDKKDQLVVIDFPDANYKEARLTLSSGESIPLTDLHTDLQFSKTGDEIVFNKDSIIRYEKNTNPKNMAQIVIPYGMRSDLLLSDGTKVFLNAGSVLIFPQKFEGKVRQVFIKGEAYFKVAKNEKVPFIVSSNDISITVHGTEFNFRNNEMEEEMEVVLVEGAVSIEDNSTNRGQNKEIKLAPMQKATYNKANKQTSVESGVNVNYYISWKDGLLEFDKESILNVFKKLSQFYNVHFVTDPSVEMNQKISGKLDLKDSLEAVLKVVSDAAPICFRIEEDKVIVNSIVRTLPMK